MLRRKSKAHVHVYHQHRCWQGSLACAVCGLAIPKRLAPAASMAGAVVVAASFTTEGR